MNKEYTEEMTDMELIEFINSKNEEVVKELIDMDNVFLQLKTAVEETKGWVIK